MKPLPAAVRWSLAVGAGLWLASAARVASIPLAVAALGLGLTLGRAGGVLAALCLGLLAGWSDRPDGGGPVPGRPAWVEARRIEEWRPDRDGMRARFRTERVRQGRRVLRWREELWVRVPGTTPVEETRLRLRGVPRRSQGLANDPVLPAGSWRLGLKSRRQLEPVPNRRGWRGAWPERLRGRLHRRLRVREPSPGLDLARALGLGERWALAPGAERALRRAGLAHLTALSGLHVALLAGGVLWLLAGCPLAVRLAAAGGAILLQLLVAGPRPSLLRAILMAFGFFAGLLLNRPSTPLICLSWVSAILALARPSWLGEPGFQLTVAATLGILLCAIPLEAAWKVLPAGLARPLAVSVGAQLGALPVAAPTFHYLLPLAPLWNLVGVPWAGVALLSSLVLLVGATIHPALAGPLQSVLDLWARPLGWLEALPAGLLRPLPTALRLPGALALAAGLTVGLRRPRWLLAGAAAVTLIALLTPGATITPELHLFDVGQGEAILLRSGGAGILVDGGGWVGSDLGGRILVPALARAGVRQIEALVMTHPDADHCLGLLDVSAYLQPAEVWMSPGWPGRGCAGRLASLPGVRVRPLWAGAIRSWGPWRIEVLHPPPGSRAVSNDRSLVLHVEANGTRLLLTGDLEPRGERLLLARRGRELRSDVLKVAHHGGGRSTSDTFLQTVDPSLALISAGRWNRYGHPAISLLERLRRRGIPTLRTDREGWLQLELHPEGRLRVHTPMAPALRAVGTGP